MKIYVITSQNKMHNVNVSVYFYGKYRMILITNIFQCINRWDEEIMLPVRPHNRATREFRIMCTFEMKSLNFSQSIVTLLS